MPGHWKADSEEQQAQARMKPLQSSCGHSCKTFELPNEVGHEERTRGNKHQALGH